MARTDAVLRRTTHLRLIASGDIGTLPRGSGLGAQGSRLRLAAVAARTAGSVCRRVLRSSSNAARDRCRICDGVIAVWRRTARLKFFTLANPAIPAAVSTFVPRWRTWLSPCTRRTRRCGTRSASARTSARNCHPTPFVMRRWRAQFPECPRAGHKSRAAVARPSTPAARDGGVRTHRRRWTPRSSAGGEGPHPHRTRSRRCARPDESRRRAVLPVKPRVEVHPHPLREFREPRFQLTALGHVGRRRHAARQPLEGFREPRAVHVEDLAHYRLQCRRHGVRPASADGWRGVVTVGRLGGRKSTLFCRFRRELPKKGRRILLHGAPAEPEFRAV